MSNVITQAIRDKMADKIKQLRIKKQMTQTETAIQADIDPSYYPRIERGESNITLETLFKLVKALKVKSSDILPF